MKILKLILDFSSIYQLEKLKFIKNYSLKLIVENRLKRVDYSNISLDTLHTFNLGSSLLNFIYDYENQEIFYLDENLVKILKFDNRSLKTKNMIIEKDSIILKIDCELSLKNTFIISEKNNFCNSNKIIVKKENEIYKEMIGVNDFDGSLCLIYGGKGNIFDRFNYSLKILVLIRNVEKKKYNQNHLTFEAHNDEIFILQKINETSFLSIKDLSYFLIMKKSKILSQNSNIYEVAQKIENDKFNPISCSAIIDQHSFITGSNGRIFLWNNLSSKNYEYEYANNDIPNEIDNFVFKLKNERTLLSLLRLNSNCFLTDTKPYIWHRISSNSHFLGFSIKESINFRPIVQISENILIIFSERNKKLDYEIVCLNY